MPLSKQLEEVIDSPYSSPEKVPAQSDDALAAFRLQARQELEERGKMSDAALAKLRAIRELDKARAAVDDRFATALKSVMVTPENLVKLIQTCNVSMPVTQIERRAQKLAWWIAAGYRLGEEIDGIAMVNLFSELVDEERTMSESKFTSLWPASAAMKLKASRLSRGLIGSDVTIFWPCKSGQKCMKAERRRPAPAKGSGQYCSSACGASDRARAKRTLAATAIM
jgi:hypothetical protein